MAWQCVSEATSKSLSDPSHRRVDGSIGFVVVACSRRSCRWVEWIVMYWSTIDVTFSSLLASELRQLWVNQSTGGLIDTVLASVDMGHLFPLLRDEEIDHYFYDRLLGKEYNNWSLWSTLMLSITTGFHRPTPRWSIMIMIDFGSIIRDYDMNFLCGCSDCRVLGVPNGTSWCMFLHHMYWLIAEQQCSLVL